MYKFALKFAAVLVGVLACSLTFSSCGDDDDDDEDFSTGNGGPTSITVMGQPILTFAYNSNGRMTSLRNEDLQMTINYSPLTIKIVEEGGSTTFSDITVNSAGFITKAKVTDYHYEDGDQETYWETFAYDKNGHVTESFIDGERTSFNWENGNLMSISYEYDDEEEYDDDIDVITFTYSSQKNTAGVCSPMWSDFGLFIMTGLFGNVPANFPSSIDSYGERMSFSYKLYGDGRINTETMSMNGYSMEFTYNYGGSRAGASGVSENVNLPKFNINTFKRTRK